MPRISIDVQQFSSTAARDAYYSVSGGNRAVAVAGDICVIRDPGQPNPTQTIQIYDGSQWRSSTPSKHRGEVS